MEYEDKNGLQLKRKSYKGVRKVPKTELEIKPIGEPDIKALPESEQLTFFETLLARLKELQANSGKQD